MDPATLLRRLFLVFLSNTLSEIRGRALVIFALHFYNTGISMQDHTGNDTHGDLCITQTAFTDEELKTYLETLQLESSKKKTTPPSSKILKVTFVLNVQMRQCGELQIHSGRRKIPHPKLTKRDYDLTIGEKAMAKIDCVPSFPKKKSFLSRPPTYSIFHETKNSQDNTFVAMLTLQASATVVMWRQS